MQIAKFTIKNFMNISALTIESDKFVQITGKNAQGKTAILRALETIFTGSTDGRFIKHGENQSELVLESPDETIRRVLNPKGHSVTVSKGEFKVQSPQTYLETIMDFRSFNPLSFLDPKNRKTAILEALAIKITPEKLADYAGTTVEELPPVDFTLEGLKVLDRAYEFYYARRAEANKDALAKKNEFEVKSKDFAVMEAPKKSKADIESDRLLANKQMDDIKSQMMLANTLIQNNKSAVEKVERYKKAVTDLHLAKDKFVFDTNEQIEELQSQIVNLQKSLTEGAKAFDKRISDAKPYLAEAEKEVREVPDVSLFEDSLNSAQVRLNHLAAFDQQWLSFENNSKAAGMIDDLKNKYESATAVASDYDLKVQNLKDAKSRAIKESNLPIEGLEVLGEEFFINGTNLDNLSTAEATMIGLEIAQILARKTKLICIDKFETLDSETRAKFIEKAKKDDFFYFFTDVEGEAMPGVQTIEMKGGAALQ